MKTRLTLLICSAALLGACNKETIKGEGSINTETRSTPGFTNVELEGNSSVTIGYGTTQSVTVNGYRNLLGVFETTVQGNTLRLRFRSDMYNVKNNNIKVNITVPELASLRINGSGNMTAGDFANGDVLSASVNGSGEMFIGNSAYNKVAYIVNGSGAIRAASTISADAQARISGSGKIDLKVYRKLTAGISGSGSINYWGNPVTVETQVSGSGKITKK